MTLGNKASMTALALAFTAPPALAAGGGGGNEVFAVGGVTALLLLGALPLAIILRTASVPSAALAAAFEERAFLKRVAGVVVLVLLILALSAGVKAPAVGGVLALVFAAFLLVALAGTARYLGTRLFRDEARGDGVGAFTLGWLLLAGLSLLPILGFLAFLYYLAWGIGALVLDLFTGRRKPPVLDEVPEGDTLEG